MATGRRRRIATANGRRLAATTALLAFYAWWLFTQHSPWAAPFAALGRDMPELIAGFPADAPAEALGRLGAARADYLWFQAFDLLFALLAALAAAFAIAIEVRRLGAGGGANFGDGRALLLAPALYFLCELAENTLLALFASGGAEPTRALSLAQQAATVSKFTALAFCILFAAVAFASTMIAGVLRLGRRPS